MSYMIGVQKADSQWNECVAETTHASAAAALVSYLLACEDSSHTRIVVTIRRIDMVPSEQQSPPLPPIGDR